MMFAWADNSNTCWGDGIASFSATVHRAKHGRRPGPRIKFSVGIPSCTRFFCPRFRQQLLSTWRYPRWVPEHQATRIRIPGYPGTGFSP
eukprot:398021-Rhodomonas_salina.1